MPEAFLRAAPSFKESFFGYSNLSSSSIIDVDFSAIVDGYVVGIGKFACAKKGGGHVEYLVGVTVSGDEGVSCETSAGCGACVTYG